MKFRTFCLIYLALHVLAAAAWLGQPPKIVTDPLERWRLSLPQIEEIDE